MNYLSQSNQSKATNSLPPWIEKSKLMSEAQILSRLLIAAVAGALIGIEREYRGHPAGFRTHLLVCVGAALIMLTNIYLCGTYVGTTDVTRMAAQIVSGIGFLGAGAIIRSGANIRGLTTAATLWISAAIGIAAGAGFTSGLVYTMIIVAVGLTLLRPVGNLFSKGKKNHLDPSE